MNKYLIIILFLNNFLSANFDSQISNRIRHDFNLRGNHIERNSYNNEDELLQFIESTMQTHLIPGLSFSIVKDNNIVLEKQLGYANIDESILVDENTMFILSSISKTVTATALMQLFEDGQFELDDHINNYLPFNVIHPNYPLVPITFKMLLSHLSGIQDNWNIMPYYNGDSNLELSYYLKEYLTSGGEFYESNSNFTNAEPGTNYSYSNIGTALIGLLVEQISNQSFNEYCIENIFQPLGMNDAYWFLSEIENLNQVASPHQLAEGSTDSLVVLENYGYSDYPAGQLRTTSNDLAKFLSAFNNDGLYNGIQLLNIETIDIMKTIHYPDAAYDQGLMWYYKSLNGSNLFGHSGSDLGSVTEMFLSSSENIGIVLLSNSRNHEGMALIESAVFDYATQTDFIPSGDLNFDSVLSDEDISILVNLILEEGYDFISDLNYDNNLDVFDLLELINVIIP